MTVQTGNAVDAPADTATFEIRHGTQDQEVFDAVVAHNQYKLANSLPADSLIIDIGANIGCFATACLLRGAGTVVCFEPDQHNFQQLAKNLSPWGDKAVAFCAGVWRSDQDEEISFAAGSSTATGCCFPHKSCPVIPRVNSAGLDQILLECTNGERRVQLLKIDAEYSEYPILFSSKRLDLVDSIIGETHEFFPVRQILGTYYEHPKYVNTAADVVRFLQDQGFTVTTERESFDNQINTLFFAHRAPTPEKA